MCLSCGKTVTTDDVTSATPVVTKGNPMIETILFEKYKIAWIAKRTGYKESYLRRIKAGHAPINKWFIRRVYDALGEEEGSLFFNKMTTHVVNSATCNGI